MRTASAATRDASSRVIRLELEKPQYPSTMTRTPKPSDSSDVRPSTF
jgi:hypothetical protein